MAYQEYVHKETIMTSINNEMLMVRCPRCGTYRGVAQGTDDFICQCETKPGTRLTSNRFSDLPDRLLHKIDERNWDSMGMDPAMPDRKMRHGTIKDKIRRTLDVDTLVPID